MPNSATKGLPSLLVFGPQAEFPPESSLQAARQELTSSPHLGALREAVCGLSEYWQELVEFDQGLESVPGAEYLDHLRQWVKNGGPFPHHQNRMPNHYALAVTVILQITQYIRYVEHLGSESHARVLEHLSAGGIQGFCVGLLSALAVASSENEAALGPSAAVALRLAVIIGAYVDRDGAYSPAATKYATVAVRWREGKAYDESEVHQIIQSTPNVSQHEARNATRPLVVHVS